MGKLCDNAKGIRKVDTNEYGTTILNIMEFSTHAELTDTQVAQLKTRAAISQASFDTYAVQEFGDWYDDQTTAQKVLVRASFAVL